MRVIQRLLFLRRRICRKNNLSIIYGIYLKINNISKYHLDSVLMCIIYEKSQEDIFLKLTIARTHYNILKLFL